VDCITVATLLGHSTQTRWACISAPVAKLDVLAEQLRKATGSQLKPQADVFELRVHAWAVTDGVTAPRGTTQVGVNIRIEKDYLSANAVMSNRARRDELVQLAARYPISSPLQPRSLF